MSLSLLDLSIHAVGLQWENFPKAGRETLPPVLQQKIMNYMIKNDLLVERDITLILPALIKRGPEYAIEGQDSSLMYPSLDLSGCKTISSKTIAQIASVCPDLQELILNGTNNVGDALLACIFENLPYLRSIEISPAFLLTDGGLDVLTPTIRNRLQVLHLKRIQRQLSLGALLSLVDECPNLRDLGFQTFIPTTQMNDELVLRIARSRMSNTLRSLVLSDCSFVTDYAVEKIIKHCRNLEVLKIGMAIKMQGTCFDRFASNNCGATLRVLDFNNRIIPPKTLMHISEVCTGLQTLGLANAPEPVDYDALKHLLVNCAHLKDLSVTVGPNAATLDCFVNLPNLKYLYLVLFHAGAGDDNENFFQDHAIERLAEGCPELETLCIRGATDNTLHILVQKLPRLRSLSLFITHLTPKEQQKRKEIEDKVRKLKSAKTRALANRTFQKKPDTTQFKEMEMELIEIEKQMREKEKEKEKRKELKQKTKDKNGGLKLSHSQGETGDAAALANKKVTRGGLVSTDLETLSLNGSNITSSEVCSLLEEYFVKGEVDGRGVGLSSISFTNCCKIGDSVLAAIACLFSHSVETLAFYKCGLVTDEGLSFIGNCGRLTSVDVRGCVMVSLKGILRVLFRCKNLETIYTPKNSLSTEERSLLRNSFPHVRVTLSSQ